MTIPVTRTKYIVPRRRPDLLSRPRLVDVLNDLLDNRLTIIAAPAGYGKTSLMVDIAHQTNMPFCWFAIDPLDRDLKRFVTYFIAAINLQFSSFGKQSSLVLENLSQVEPDLDLLVTSLVNEAYDTIREHFVIVLDDYHYVDGLDEINRFIGKFIREVDENCHLVIASRTLLAIPDLPLMVARSQVGGLGFDELAFQPAEISALIEKNYHTKISDAAAAELVKETEGWITGLLLSTQVKWEGLNDRMRLAKVSAAGLYDYMAEQVLEQQPPQVQQFLLQTSVMDEFDAELCEAVFGPPADGHENWANLMETVLRSNLFVLSVGEKGLWLRYHHLFRDFLHEKFQKQSPNLENQLLKKLADTYTQNSDWERAYALYNRLHRSEDLVNLIEKCGPDLLKTGRISTLSNWIDSVNNTFLENRPALLSLRGSVAVMQGEVERGINLLNQCEIACRRTENSLVLVRMLTRRSHANVYLCNYQDALRDADEALSIAREQAFSMDEAEALRCRGLALYFLGQFDAAIQNLNLAISTFDAIGQLDYVAFIQLELGRIHRFLGRFYQAQEVYEKALKQFVKIGDLRHLASVQNNLGYLFFALGNYEKSSYYYEHALVSAEQSGSLPMETMILTGIGDLYRNIDAPESALIAYSKAKEILKKINDRFLDFYILLAEAVIYRILGDFVHAEEKFAQANEFAGQKKTPNEEALISFEYGVFLCDQKEYAEALNRVQNAKKYFDDNRQIIEQIQCNIILCKIYQAIGKEEEALRELHNAFQLADSIQNLDILLPIARHIKPIIASAVKYPYLKSTSENLLDEIAVFESALPMLRRKFRKQASVVPIAPPKLTIKALGRNQVIIDGKIVTSPQWQSQVARDLMFLVLSDPEGLTKEAIADIFWPDNNQTQIKLQFKNTIYRVRHALDLDVIILDIDRYRFNQNIDFEYDVEVFQSRLHQAQAADSKEKQINLYKSALSQYKGIYLPEIEGTWVLLEREKLHQAFINGTLSLLDIYFEIEDHQAGLRLCQEILAKDACLEEAHRIAMKIYAAMGNKAGVVRQYERCEQTLLREVHLPPSEKTRILFEELIR